MTQIIKFVKISLLVLILLQLYTIANAGGGLNQENDFASKVVTTAKGPNKGKETRSRVLSTPTGVLDATIEGLNEHEDDDMRTILDNTQSGLNKNEKVPPKDEAAIEKMNQFFKQLGLNQDELNSTYVQDVYKYYSIDQE